MSSDQALTLYDPATVSEAVSSQALMEMRLPNVKLDALTFHWQPQTLQLGAGCNTFGAFVHTTCRTWGTLLRTGSASVKGYDTVVDELETLGVTFSEPKTHDGIAKSKKTIADFALRREFSPTSICVLARRVDDMCRVHSELTNLLITHLKRQVAELTAKLARAELDLGNLRNTNVQLDAKLNCYIQEAESNRTALVAFHKVKSDPYEIIRAELKRENEQLKQENAKVVELDKNLALTNQAAEHQGQLAEVTHDKSLLVKEMQLTKEFEQLLQSKLNEQKEKYSAKIRKIKAERKFYRNKCMELMKPITNDRDDSFTAI